MHLYFESIANVSLTKTHIHYWPICRFLNKNHLVNSLKNALFNAMKNSIFLVLLVTSVSFGQDMNLYQRKNYTNSKGDSIPYRILFPENYDRSKKYPLVLFLHGAGERGNDNEKQLVHGSKLFLTEENRKKFQAIVLFPQCPENSYWASMNVDANKERTFDYKGEMPKPLRAAIALTKHIIENEAVDEHRVYITGLSMGGMDTFESVYRFPKMFAAAAPICGAGNAAAYSKKQAKTPFWLFHGDADKSVDVKYSRIMNDRLKELKGDVKYSEYPGVGHNSWDNAFADPEYLPWLFSKRR